MDACRGSRGRGRSDRCPGGLAGPVPPAPAPRPTRPFGSWRELAAPVSARLPRRPPRAWGERPSWDVQLSRLPSSGLQRASRLFTSTPNSSSVRFPRRPRRGEGACPSAGRGRWRPPPPVTGRHRRVQGEGRRGAESPTPVLWRGRQRLHSATGRRSQCPRDIPPGLGLQTHRPLSVSSRD